MKSLVWVGVLGLFFQVASAAEPATGTSAFRDAKDYVDTIERASKLKIDDQIDAWQTFLSDHPQHTFRKEIEKNIEHLEELSQKKSNKKGDEKDADLYLKALEFSKKLSIDDQILLWQQFLDENPTSIYRNDVQTRLYKLKRSRPASPTPTGVAPSSTLQPTATPPTPSATVSPGPAKSVVSIQPMKDPDRALMMASLPGIIVPGMGHWYTHDYLIAGVLTFMRLTGIGLAIPGLIKPEYAMVYIGGGFYFVSYALDIADAPFSARRFNDAHTQLSLNFETKPSQTFPLFAYTFRF